MNTIAIKSGGQTVALNDASFRSALNDKFTPMGARLYAATAFGYTSETIKHAPDAAGKVVGKSMKEIQAEIIAGKSEAETKEILARFAARRKEYNEMLEAYAGASTKGVALLAVDAGMKKILKPVLDKNGNHNGRWVARFAPISAKSGSNAAAKIVQLEATIARLQAVVAGLPAPATA